MILNLGTIRGNPGSTNNVKYYIRILGVCESLSFSKRIHSFYIHFLCCVTNCHKLGDLKNTHLCFTVPGGQESARLTRIHCKAAIKASKFTLVLGRIHFLVLVGLVTACFNKINKTSKTLDQSDSKRKSHIR